MKHWINKIIWTLCSCLLLVGCSEEDWTQQQGVVGPNVHAVLSFGATHHDQIEINTRMTYDLYYESMVRNVYAFVFASGNF